MTCPYINPTIAQCQNCPLPDCVNDRISTTDIKASKEIDRYIIEPNFSRDNARKKSAKYNASHREENRNKAKRHYQDNPEKVINRVREWQIENKEYWNAYMREYGANKRNRRTDLWSEDDIGYLTKKWGKVQMKTLIKRLKRSRMAIYVKASRLRLIQEKQAV